MHEVLIASSILAITISGFTSGIIRSNQVTHQASLRQAAEGLITNDLESTVKSRFYTYRCSQGPCKAAPEENTKSLMYYDREDSKDKDDFISHCKAGDLARDLLKDEDDVSTVSSGNEIIYESPDEDDQEDTTPLANQDIRIIRTIELDDSNKNRAIIKYEAEKDNKIIATVMTTLVPNAVHWCS